MASRRLQELISALFDYNDQSDGDESYENTDLNQVINEAAALIRFPLSSISYNSRLPSVNVQPAQMLRVFMNLLDNAKKYSAPGRDVQVTIDTEETEIGWKISLKDNGIGIQDESIHNIFRMFHRVESKSEVEGTGIGLSVCRKIIENHGGNIWAKSRGDLKGTTFFITLPRRP